MDDDGRLSYHEFIQIMRDRYARRTQVGITYGVNCDVWMSTAYID